MIGSLLNAFRMFSRLPVPKAEWNEKNKSYMLCFFPLVGVVSGIFLILWYQLCDVLCMDGIIFGAGAVAITVLVTGGIHLDGFCDVSDARASWGDRQKKLEILDDPHIGAFAAIKLGVYLVIYAALLSVTESISTVLIVSCGYVFSRSLSGLTAIAFRTAKNGGMLYSFTKPADKKIAAAVLIFIGILSCCGMIASDAAAGTAAVAAAFLTVVYYRFTAYREFGGISGDLAGWFLQLCELFITAAAVFVYSIKEVI